MTGRLFELWRGLPRAARRPLRRTWYELLSSLDSGDDLLFMNHGLAGAESLPPLRLRPEDEPHRYSIRLYHQLTSRIEWAGKDVLEVGCGRGGGAAWIRRYLSPRSVVGVDVTRSAIRFCRRRFREEGLRFERCDAHALAFPDGSFDAVVNVESSVLYEDAARFFREVERVLRPGGFLLLADSRSRGKLARLHAQLAGTALEKLEEDDVSAQVAEALRLDARRRLELVDRMVPRALRGAFRGFAHLEDGGRERRLLEAGEKVYLCLLYRKPVRSGAMKPARGGGDR